MSAPSNRPALYYVGLESYESRYTLQLTEWVRTEISRIKGLRTAIRFVEVPGQETTNKEIKVGQVLDAFGRSHYAMSQISYLLNVLATGKTKPSDVFFFEDMFHPGIEALAYAFNQLPDVKRPVVVVRCLAQTIDPDDFVHSTGMFDWMRKYEEMVLSFVDAVCVASHEMAAHFTVAGWGSTRRTTRPRVFVTGLPFSKSSVLKMFGDAGCRVKPFNERKDRVVFASRTDWEKQPEFFIGLARSVKMSRPDVEFAFVTGTTLKSNSPQCLRSIKEAVSSGLVKVYENQTKLSYYGLLNDSKVLFNCALQDWVSNTVSEADTLGCNVLFPAYRSFPEVFESDPTRLYIPWSLSDAEAKLDPLLLAASPRQGQISVNQSNTVKRTMAVLQELAFRHATVYDLRGLWQTRPLEVNPGEPQHYRPYFSSATWEGEIV